MRANEKRGVLAWLIKNSVLANVLMIAILVGGALMSQSIKREVVPESNLDVVVVDLPYPGASPGEVEQGVTLAAEEAVRGIDGVKRVTSTSAENAAQLLITVSLDHDGDRVMSDVESAIARVQSFPKEAEKPTTALMSTRFQLLSLVVYGDVEEASLRSFTEKTRDQLLALPEIGYAELAAVRPLEVSIEVPQAKLSQYRTTLDEVAQRARGGAIDLPGGGIDTASGELLLRTRERRDDGAQLGEVVVFSRPDGTRVRVRDLANVEDGFADTKQAAFFNGKRAALIQVYQVTDDGPEQISQAVSRFIDERAPHMPEGVSYAMWNDFSELYTERLDLMLRNGAFGLVLVLLVLGLFLELRLAFWVALGIPICFLGALVLMPLFGVTINMISMFAFIVCLGMVVDDAIIIGEAVYRRRTLGDSRLQAAITGTREVAVPVIFAVATTIIAFSPMLFLPGSMGKFFRVIPITVISVLILSLIESLLILPVHLGHSGSATQRGVLGFVHRQQQRFSRGIEWLIERTYAPVLRVAIRRRFTTVAAALALFIGSCGLLAGGQVEFTFMPKIEEDVVMAQIEMPFGAPVEDTERVTERVLAAGYQVLQDHGGPEGLSRGVLSQVGGQTLIGGSAWVASVQSSHLAEVAINLVPSAQRSITAEQLASQWREQLGAVAGIDSIKFIYSTMAGSAPPIDIRLSHPELATLEAAGSDLAEILAGYIGVYNVDDGFAVGKERLDFTMKPEGLARGLSAAELGRQVRSAFFGAEVLRQQRGRNELKVYVRLPESERQSEHAIESFLLRTPDGGQMPLGQAATVTRSRAQTRIIRRDGQQVINITAEAEPGVANADKITAELHAGPLPELAAKYPGLTYANGGQQQDQQELMGGMGSGFLIAMIVIIALLAIAFKSYAQWIVIISVVPFGFVGALWGHVVMGMDLSMVSFMGIVALAGVVINDSLVLIVAINEAREGGMSRFEAIVWGGTRRFRPILLTSLTTFFGLVPMILETSMQARLLVPMAISLGFGVIFATFIMLLLVPAVYVVVDDTTRALGRLFGVVSHRFSASAHGAMPEGTRLALDTVALDP